MNVGVTSDGKIPAVDVHVSPSGKKYARSDWGDSTGGSGTGVIQLERDFGPPPQPVAPRPSRPPVQRQKVSEFLSDKVFHSSPSDIIPLTVRTSRAHIERPLIQMRRRIALGDVATDADYESEYQKIMDDRRAAIRAHHAPIVQRILAAGAVSARSCEAQHCIKAYAPANAVPGIASLQEVRIVDTNHPLAPGAVITGDEVRIGTQIAQFMMDCYYGSCSYNSYPTYDGENQASTPIPVAILEVGTFYDGHPGFKDTTSSGSRILSTWKCTSSGCSTDSWSPNGSGSQQHATRVTGLILGDLFDAQDTAVTSFADRHRRSGYAGEAEAYLYQTAGSGSRTEAYNHVDNRNPVPALMNESTWSPGAATNCNGMTTNAEETNELFEKLILPVKIGGNPSNGHSNNNDCTVTLGADAIGAFTVTAHGKSDASQSDEERVREGDLLDKSPRGGVSYSEGRNRSIIDISAVGSRGRLFNNDSDCDPDPTALDCDLYAPDSSEASGTSFAAPTVTSAAVDYIDWYQNNISNLITGNPGIVFANLLLFGDRQEEGGGKRVGRYDHIWGAGRLQMRKLDGEGLDGPYSWRVLDTCIDDGENAYTPTFTTDSRSDVIKGALFWYDRRHEDGTDIDNINLYLEYNDGGTWTTYASSTDAYDNKERIFRDITSLGSRTWRWRFYGADVTSDEEGCGDDSMMVYFAMFAEDSARNDVNGPVAGDGIDTED